LALCCALQRKCLREGGVGEKKGDHRAQDGGIFAERELVPLPVKLRGKLGTIKRKIFP